MCNRLGHITIKGEERGGCWLLYFPPLTREWTGGIRNDNDSTAMMSVLNEIKIICLVVAAVIF